MLGRNYTYKWYDLSDFNFSVNSTALQNVTKNVFTREASFNFSNTHWSFIGPTLESERVFTFSGVIHDTDEIVREQKFYELYSIFAPESNPFDEQFHDLTWETKAGSSRFVKAKVLEPPRPTNGLCDPTIEFTIGLKAASGDVFDPQQRIATGGVWFIGGTTLDTTLSTTMYEVQDSILLNNEGDRRATCRVEITGDLINPKLFILDETETNILYFLRIDATTTSLVVENTDNDFAVTDLWQNIKNSIKKEGWGWPLFVTANGGRLVVTCDNHLEVQDTAVVTVKRFNTYSY